MKIIVEKFDDIIDFNAEVNFYSDGEEVYDRDIEIHSRAYDDIRKSEDFDELLYEVQDEIEDEISNGLYEGDWVHTLKIKGAVLYTNYAEDEINPSYSEVKLEIGDTDISHERNEI